MLCKEFRATILMVTHDALSDSYYDRILFMQASLFYTYIRNNSQIAGDDSYVS